MLVWIVAAAPLVAFVYCARRELARLFVIALLRSVYRLRAFGREHVPVSGGALLVPNHVSMIDGLWVGAVLRRTVFFLMHRDFAKTPIIGPFTAMMGTIPVATGDSPEAKAESLRKAGERCASGDLVCIFAEGVITRSGALMPFMKGLERIAQAGEVPIVPIALDRVWGSLFSFSGRRFLWKKPRRLPYPIDVIFGAPLPFDTPAFIVRDAVQELLARAREARASEMRPLGYRFLRSARKNARHPAVIESEGASARHAELATSVLALQPAWRRLKAARAAGAGASARVATLFDAGRDANVAHALLALERDVAIPIDPRDPDACELARAAGAELVLAPKDVLARAAKLASAFGPRAIALEDVSASPELADRALARAAALLPGPLLARLIDGTPGARAPLAIFAVRRAGAVKRVVLSHANLIANVQSLAQAFDFGPEDRIACVPGLDDPLGYLAAFWLPACCGAATVIAPTNDGRVPDAPSIARACREQRVSVLVLDPLTAQRLPEVATREDLAALRCAFVDGSRIDAGLVERWNDVLGKPLHTGWGLAELAPVATTSLHDIESGKWLHAGSRPGSVGRAISGVALRVVDPHSGVMVPSGELGRLLVRGPVVMLGYLDDAAATNAVMREGWLDTGLAARLDKDGFLFLEPRAN